MKCFVCKQLADFGCYCMMGFVVVFASMTLASFAAIIAGLEAWLR